MASKENKIEFQKALIEFTEGNEAPTGLICIPANSIKSIIGEKEVSRIVFHDHSIFIELAEETVNDSTNASV